ncbi:MAG: hypothetical protein HGB11_11410, partial [Chlorobiales bacterium]|nr:hypothetical protein [Chlorobiales bacterium]
MPVENEKKIHKISDIADELQVGAQDVLAFIKEQGIKVATSSSKVSDDVRVMVLDHYSDEKKKSDLHRRHKEDKQRKLKRIEGNAPAAIEKESAKKKASLKQQPAEVESVAEEAGLFTSPEEAEHREVLQEEHTAAEEAAVNEHPHEAEVVEVPHADKEVERVPVEHVEDEAPVVSEVQEHVSHTEEVAQVEHGSIAEEAAVSKHMPEPEDIDAIAKHEEITEDAVAEIHVDATVEEELTEDVLSEESEEVDDAVAHTEIGEEIEQDSDLKSEITRQQTEIGTRFSQVENIGGLKV